MVSPLCEAAIALDIVLYCLPGPTVRIVMVSPPFYFRSDERSPDIRHLMSMIYVEVSVFAEYGKTSPFTEWLPPSRQLQCHSCDRVGVRNELSHAAFSRAQIPRPAKLTSTNC